MNTTPTRPGQTTLDTAPPPSTKGKQSSLLDTQGQSNDAKVPPSPQVAAMLGMNMLEQGSRLISMALPALAPGLQQVIMQLRDAIPKAMGDSLAGMPPAMGGGVPAGGPPAAPPPPPGAVPQQ